MKREVTIWVENFLVFRVSLKFEVTCDVPMGNHYHVLSYLVVTKTLKLTYDSERSTPWRRIILWKLPYLDSWANGGEALELACLETCYKDRK